MLNKRESILNKFMTIINFGITISAFLLSYYLNINRISAPQKYQLFIIILFIVVLIINLNINNFFRKKHILNILYERFINSSIILIFSLIIISALKLFEISRLFLIVFIGSNFILGIFFDLILNKIIDIKKKNKKNVLIYADKHSCSFIKKLQNNDYQPYNIIHIITEEDALIYKEVLKGATTVIQENNFKLRDVLRQVVIDDIFYIREDIEIKKIKIISNIALEIGTKFHIKSNFIHYINSKSQLNFIEENPFLSLSTTPNDYLALKIKSLIDKVFSLLVIIILSPLFILVAIAIKLESKGPVFFLQKRQGLRNRNFTCYKFRTMVENAEELKKELIKENEQKGPVFKIKNDPRITKVGKILRKISLDELPQFFNVIKGDMSVVGPRPPLEEEVKKYKPWQLRRLAMKPGITCIWQVSGRNKITFDRWMELDLQYIDNWSLKLDFLIILKTIAVVLKGDGQ